MPVTMLVAAVSAILGQPAASPSPDRIAWINERSIPLKTVEAGNGFEDLQPLKKIIGDARVVALGEGTHGTREFFQMKHRLMEFLASEMGFTIFSIEANMPESYRVDEFVSKGEGDPEKLIRGMYFWTWSTDEVADMVRWMRKFNEAGKGHVRFTGFDMQTLDVAAGIVKEYLEKVDPAYARTASNAYVTVKQARPSGSGAGFGVASAAFPVDKVRGKHIALKGWIRTEGVTAYAGLWWRADGKDGAVAAFDNMGGRGPSGTKDWAEYSVELDIPADAANTVFGVLMPGKGKAWFDGIRIEIDGKPFDAAELFDLDFEGPQLKGLVARMHDRAKPEGYGAEIDKAIAKSGKQSLRIEYLPGVEAKAEGPPPAAAAKVARDVLDHMVGLRDEYAGKTSMEDADWAIQNARVVEQCCRMNASNNGFFVRDESMAANVKWILDQAPAGSKIVLWAHNGHVNRMARCMGSHLAKMYGTDMVVLGFATTSGEYSAMGDGSLGTHPLAPPPPESLEWYLHATGVPRLIFDVRNPPESDRAGAWLGDVIKLRSIGALRMENQFQEVPVSAFYDAIVYVDKTTAARQLKK